MGHSLSQPTINSKHTPAIGDLKSVGVAKSKRAMVEKDVDLLHNRIKVWIRVRWKGREEIGMEDCAGDYEDGFGGSEIFGRCVEGVVWVKVVLGTL